MYPLLYMGVIYVHYILIALSKGRTWNLWTSTAAPLQAFYKNLLSLASRYPATAPLSLLILFFFWPDIYAPISLTQLHHVFVCMFFIHTCICLIGICSVLGICQILWLSNEGLNFPSFLDLEENLELFSYNPIKDRWYELSLPYLQCTLWPSKVPLIDYWSWQVLGTLEVGGWEY